MGFWSSIGSAFSGVSSVQSEKPEDSATYKKYEKDIKNFELDSKMSTQASSHQNNDAKKVQIQDELGDIESVDDVKKHFDKSE